MVHVPLMPAAGAKAPHFTLPDQDGTLHSPAEVVGSWLVLYAYPKDDTTGCTTEACGFRDQFAVFKQRGVVVMGISPDSVESHKQFSDKHGLPFTLLSDPSKETLTSYGVWGEKSMYGKKYMGVLRTTFLIDPNGVIAKVYTNVSPEGHAEIILNDIQSWNA